MANQLDRIDKAMTSLVLDQPFFAVLAMKLKVSENTQIPTFATNGRDLFVNPEFCASLSEKEIVTVLAHEVLHCALGHSWRMPVGHDAKLWNVACDNEVNWELEENNVLAKSRSAVAPFPWPKCGKEMPWVYESARRSVYGCGYCRIQVVVIDLSKGDENEKDT